MKKQVILIHTFVSILTAGLLYFYEPFFAKSFFLASLAFNFYLRLLYKGFEAPLTSLRVERSNLVEENNAIANDSILDCHDPSELAMTGTTEDKIKINPWTALASVFRVVLVAGILAVLIMKFKLNLIAAGAAFLTYQLILIAIGFYYNASYHRRNT